MIQCAIKGKRAAHGIDITLFWFTCMIYKISKKQPMKSLSRKKKKVHF